MARFFARAPNGDVNHFAVYTRKSYVIGPFETFEEADNAARVLIAKNADYANRRRAA